MFLLLLVGSLLAWAGWVAVLNVVLHGLGDSLVQTLELCGRGIVSFGLVACIQYREAADPLQHNLMYILEATLLEATLGRALLPTLWIYRTTKRAYYES